MDIEDLGGSHELKWTDVGAEEQLKQKPLQEVSVGEGKSDGSGDSGGKTAVALTYDAEKRTFHAISNACSHLGGPLADGHFDGRNVVCPWHGAKFDCETGMMPGNDKVCVPAYAVRVENGRVYVSNGPVSKFVRALPEHPLRRPPVRAPGPIRVCGISTTNMNADNPRFSTSDFLLNFALDHAKTEMKADVKLLKLRDLKVKNCEGNYSKSANACTWPCAITAFDKLDEMEQVYEAMVHWADVIIVSTPIRWGQASALYYRMTERLNCVQNQITINDTVLIKNKVASFIITGGQDNVQGLAGQMLCFFAELGFQFPQFPYVAHSRGWDAEDMEQNISFVQKSDHLQQGAKQLAQRSILMAQTLLDAGVQKKGGNNRAGRKAHRENSRLKDANHPGPHLLPQQQPSVPPQ